MFVKQFKWWQATSSIGIVVQIVTKTFVWSKITTIMELDYNDHGNYEFTFKIDQILFNCLFKKTWYN